MEHIHIHVKQGRNLIAADVNGFSDPYLIISVFNSKLKKPITKKRISTKYKTLNPIWNEEINLSIDLNNTKILRDKRFLKLKIQCWDYDVLSPDDFLGQLVIDLYPNPWKGKSDWFALVDRHASSEYCGEIQLSIKRKIPNLQFKTPSFDKATTPPYNPTIDNSIKSPTASRQRSLNKSDNNKINADTDSESTYNTDLTDLAASIYIPKPQLEFVKMKGNSIEQTLGQPSYCELVMFAKLAYHSVEEYGFVDNQTTNFWNPLKNMGWRVWGSVECGLGDFWGVIFVHDARKQIVYSIRGTKSFGSGYTDVQGVVLNMSTGQHSAFYTLLLRLIQSKEFDFIKYSSDEDSNLNFGGFRLTFTGHSLGGWLAEIGTVDSRKHGVWSTATSFDSPGSRRMISTLLESYNLQIDPAELGIIAYFSAPNLINMSCTHVSTAMYTTYSDHVLQTYIQHSTRSISHINWAINTFSLHTANNFIKYGIDAVKKPIMLSVVNRTWPSYTVAGTTAVKHFNRYLCEALQHLNESSKFNLKKDASFSLEKDRPNRLFIHMLPPKLAEFVVIYCQLHSSPEVLKSDGILTQKQRQLLSVLRASTLHWASNTSSRNDLLLLPENIFKSNEAVKSFIDDLLAFAAQPEANRFISAICQLTVQQKDTSKALNDYLAGLLQSKHAIGDKVKHISSTSHLNLSAYDSATSIGDIDITLDGDDYNNDIGIISCLVKLLQSMALFSFASEKEQFVVKSVVHFITSHDKPDESVFIEQAKLVGSSFENKENLTAVHAKEMAKLTDDITDSKVKSAIQTYLSSHQYQVAASFCSSYLLYKPNTEDTPKIEQIFGQLIFWQIRILLSSSVWNKYIKQKVRSGHFTEVMPLLTSITSMYKTCHDMANSVDELLEMRKLLLEKLKDVRRNVRSHSGTFKETAVAKVAAFIANEYQAIIQTMCTFIVSRIGLAPCKFCLLAFGPFARGELACYSNIDLAIIIESSLFNPYFLLFSKLLNLMIVSCAEGLPLTQFPPSGTEDCPPITNSTVRHLHALFPENSFYEYSGFCTRFPIVFGSTSQLFRRILLREQDVTKALKYIDKITDLDRRFCTIYDHCSILGNKLLATQFQLLLNDIFSFNYSRPSTQVLALAMKRHIQRNKEVEIDVDLEDLALTSNFLGDIGSLKDSIIDTFVLIKAISDMFILLARYFEIEEVETIARIHVLAEQQHIGRQFAILSKFLFIWLLHLHNETQLKHDRAYSWIQQEYSGMEYVSIVLQYALPTLRNMIVDFLNWAEKSSGLNPLLGMRIVPELKPFFEYCHSLCKDVNYKLGEVQCFSAVCYHCGTTLTNAQKEARTLLFDEIKEADDMKDVVLSIFTKHIIPKCTTQVENLITQWISSSANREKILIEEAILSLVNEARATKLSLWETLPSTSEGSIAITITETRLLILFNLIICLIPDISVVINAYQSAFLAASQKQAEIVAAGMHWCEKERPQEPEIDVPRYQLLKEMFHGFPNSKGIQLSRIVQEKSWDTEMTASLISKEESNFNIEWLSYDNNIQRGFLSSSIANQIFKNEALEFNTTASSTGIIPIFPTRNTQNDPAFAFVETKLEDPIYSVRMLELLNRVTGAGTIVRLCKITNTKSGKISLITLHKNFGYLTLTDVYNNCKTTELCNQMCTIEDVAEFLCSTPYFLMALFTMLFSDINSINLSNFMVKPVFNLVAKVTQYELVCINLISNRDNILRAPRESSVSLAASMNEDCSYTSKNVLFCFDEFQEKISIVAALQFLKLDPLQLLPDWLSFCTARQAILFQQTSDQKDYILSAQHAAAGSYSAFHISYAEITKLKDAFLLIQRKLQKNLQGTADRNHVDLFESDDDSTKEELTKFENMDSEDTHEIYQETASVISLFPIQLYHVIDPIACGNLLKCTIENDTFTSRYCRMKVHQRQKAILTSSTVSHINMNEPLPVVSKRVSSAFKAMVFGQKFQTNLQNGGTLTLSALKQKENISVFIEELIKCNWHGLDEDTTNVLLALIGTNDVENVNITGSQLLTTKTTCKKFLTKNIKHLNLKHCSPILSGIVKHVSHHAPNLLSTSFSHSSIIECNGKFKYLNSLIVDRCSSLQKVNIQAPFLRYFSAKNCYQLSVVAIASQMLEQAIITGSKQLTWENIKFSWKTCRILDFSDCALLASSTNLEHSAILEQQVKAKKRDQQIFVRYNRKIEKSKTKKKINKIKQETKEKKKAAKLEYIQVKNSDGDKKEAKAQYKQVKTQEKQIRKEAKRELKAKLKEKTENFKQGALKESDEIAIDIKESKPTIITKHISSQLQK